MKETIGKKAAFAAIAVLIMLAIITAFCATASTVSATAAEAQGDYIAENWTAMPADDFTKCDKGNTSSQSRDYVAGRREIQLTGGAGAVSAGGGKRLFVKRILYKSRNRRLHGFYVYDDFSRFVLFERRAVVRHNVPHAKG